MTTSVQDRKDKAPPAGFLVGVIALEGSAAAIAVATRQELLAFALVVGVAAVSAMVRYPLLWLCTLALAAIPLFFLQGPTVEPTEVVLVLFLLAVLVGWLLWQGVVERRRLFQHWGDVLLVLFLLLSGLNAPLALLNDVPIEEWLRRWLPMWLLLSYIPVRMLVRTPRQLLLLLMLLLLAGVVIAGATVERYRSGVALAEYAYQLRSGYARTQGEHFLAFALVSCLIGAAFGRALLWRLFLVGCAIVMAVAIVVTFSRTAWLSVLLGLAVGWMLLSWRQRLQTLLLGGALVAVALGVLVATFPRVSSILLRLIEQRFLSLAVGRQRDLALQGRFFQLQKALEQTCLYPLGGHGLGKAFPYYEAGARRHIHYSYIHNGYVATAYRYGIPLALLLLVALGTHLVNAFRQLRRTPPGSLWRMAAVTGCAGMVGVMFSLMMTENPLDMRMTTLTLAWVLALANVSPPSARNG
ncbi:hypothetical protein HRbin21_01112 [bacterium HR21]|nr:hypothetical protein HRbin21_01112 [bacterium HR21]